jgi:hypothetical protein
MRSPAVRLAVTLLLPVLVVLAAERVLLPGVEDLLGNLARGTGDPFYAGRSHLSVFALGVGPVLTAYGIVELTAFLVPRWSRLRHGNPEGRLKLERAACAVAIVLAALQAFGVAQSLAHFGDGFDFMTAGFDAPPQWLVVATLVGGVCVQLVVAQIISRQGIVNGFVMLSVVEAVAALRGSVLAPLQNELFLGLIEPKHVVLVVLVFALPAVATWLALRGGDARVARSAESGGDTSAAPYRAARALAVSPWVPIPASSLSPYPIALALSGLPLALVSTLRLGHDATANAQYLSHDVPFTILLAVLTVGLAVALARLLHRPREMTNVASLVGLAGGEETTTEAHAAVRAALVPTLLFFAVLVCVAAAGIALPLHPSVIFVPLLVALLLDAAASLRNAQLVAVWQERRASAVPVVRAVLAAEGIESSVRGLAVLSLLQVFAPYAPAEIVVAEDDVARATAVLRHVFLGRERPAPEARRELAPSQDGVVVWTPARRERALGVVAVCALATAVVANVRMPAREVEKAARGRLEIVRIADEDDFFGRLPDAQVPEYVELRFENAPVGRGRTEKVSFARTDVEQGESYEAAVARMQKWTDRLALPEGTRIGLEPIDEYDADTLVRRRTGVRTYLLAGTPIITTDDVVDAVPALSTTNGMPSVYVAVTLSPESAERFRVATAASVDRRIAIVVNGQIESAPVVRSEIGGGRVSITMGSAGDTDVQLKQAKALAKSLGGR